jgi:hypothetical protein
MVWRGYVDVFSILYSEGFFSFFALGQALGGKGMREIIHYLLCAFKYIYATIL